METIKHQKLAIGSRVGNLDGTIEGTIVRRYQGSPLHFDIVLDTGSKVQFVTVYEMKKVGLTIFARTFEIK